jgi:D-sedoheptulose 7-phosphate isomerase
MYRLKQLFENSQSAAEFTDGYYRRLTEILGQVDKTSIQKVIEVIEKAIFDHKAIFLIANGGSAAVASHLVNDLVPNSLVSDKPGIRAFSLTDNVASVTAIANDSGYENIFSYQLEAYMQEGDIVVAMSVSGNSENVLRGVKYAKQHGGYAIGWTGFDGGRLAKLCDLNINIPTTRDEYGPVEDIFTILGHMVSNYLIMNRGRNLYH